MTVGYTEALKPTFYFSFLFCVMLGRPDEIHLRRVIEWLELFPPFRWRSSVSVKCSVVFRTSPRLSPAVITASARPNVVIVTYIPGKYTA